LLGGSQVIRKINKAKYIKIQYSVIGSLKANSRKNKKLLHKTNFKKFNWELKNWRGIWGILSRELYNKMMT